MSQIHLESIDKIGNIELFFWKLEENSNELAKIIAGGEMLLNEAKERFKSLQRQCEWLAARALLQQTGHRSHAIMYRPDGAPYLDGSDRYISISHTKGLVALAISQKPIGIDIEASNRNALKGAHIFLSDKEAGYVNIEELDNIEALRIWTAKEASFKLHPEGSATIIDIHLKKTKEGFNCNTYDVTFSDGCKAKSCSYEIEGYILSCSEFLH